MDRRLCFCIGLALVSNAAWAAARPPVAPPPPTPGPEATAANVILVTLDGVRWEEVFRGTDTRLGDVPQEPLFENLHGILATDALWAGNRDAGSKMDVSNPVAVSLPGYLSIFSGRPEFCFSNDCKRVKRETVGERLQRELGWARGEVATFASWQTYERAVEQVAGATVVNTGLAPFTSPFENDPDQAETERTNAAQAADLPIWGKARRDRYTMEHALRYLTRHQPRFLTIGLLDSDEWGHHGEYERYVATIKVYDLWLRNLLNQLDTMGEYGRNTTVIVTTDHGRGNSKVGWKSHAFIHPRSRAVWLYARGPATARPGAVLPSELEHVDLRPTIEAIFGLTPTQCVNCGKVLTALVP